MNKIVICALCLCGLLLAACEKTSGPRFEGDVYGLAGMLVAGKPIDIDNPVYVSRSESIEEFDPMQIFVADATVIVKDLGTGSELSLTPVFDDFKIKYIDSSNQVIQPEHRYRIEVTVPGYDKLIWAETLVPQAVTLEPDVYGSNPDGQGYSFNPDTQNTMPFDSIDSNFPLVVNTGETEASYNFYGEFFCLEEFSTDLEFTTPVLGIEHPDASMEEMYYSGGESIRRIKFLGRFSSAPQPNLEGNYLWLQDYGYIYIFYGRYKVTAYLLDDNCYKYSYMPEGYLYGGVHNALGFFGSASGGVMYTRIVR